MAQTYDTYGDQIAAKANNIFRIGFQNFNGFTGQTNDPVDETLRQWITSQEFDVFGISELNMFWPKVKQELQFLERIFAWWNPRETRAIHAYNKKEKRIKRSIRQYGGTAQISRENASLRQQSQGFDPTGLGRWVWQKFMGKQHHTLRIITAYRPVDKRDAGLFTVFIQHRLYLNAHGRKKENPRQAMLDDLSKQINNWMKQGDQIVLMMDCNSDVRKGDISKFLDETDLHDIILHTHGKEQAPRTYIDGSIPIDGIFCSHGIDMIHGGYAAFHDKGAYGERTDHRCLWIDVHLRDIFGHKMPGPCKFAGRRVKCNDPRIYKRFNGAYKKYAVKHRLSHRIFSLERQAVYPLPERLKKEANAIARLRIRGIKHADKKCRKLKFGGAEFTPEFSQLSAAVATVTYILDRKNGKRHNRKVIKRKYKKSKLDISLKQLYAKQKKDLQELQHICYQRYKAYWKHKEVARDTWLQELAKARAEAEEIKYEKYLRKNNINPNSFNNRNKLSTSQRTSSHIKSIYRNEKLRLTHKRIARAIGKEQMTGISMILIPNGTDSNGDKLWKECTSQEDITAELLKEHTKKYSQTNDTPPMTEPLSSQLGYLGATAICDQILMNEYRPTIDSNSATAKFLLQLHKTNQQQSQIPIGVSRNDYQSGWKKAREQTSAGGNTLHFGHCKAIAFDDQLSEMEAAFLSIPLRSGYPYENWKHGVDCILPKKKGQIYIDMLRTIVLFEADFNFLNKHVAKKAARRAETIPGALAKEQYGSRVTFRSIDHVFNKHISTDIIRQQKRPATLTITDLKGCYDRISHSIASLCLRRQGIAKSEVVCMFTCLQELKHTIKCAYGVSKESYQSEIWAVPLQGICQGHGAGPVIWAVISSPILDIMREAGCGAFFKAAISGQEIRLVGYAFVDDTDLIQMGQNLDTTMDKILEDNQQTLDLWEALVKATGGAINVDKCRWWAIDFNWRPNGTWYYKPMHEIPSTLTAIDYQGGRQIVKRLDTDQAYETLGVKLAPTGNLNEEYEYLLLKAKRWADKIRTAPFREQETATALKTTILKTLEYPLPAIHLKENQCDKIMSTILKAALPKARFNRHFCRQTLYGPGGHGGLEIHNLHTTQIIEHADMVLRHGPADTMAGSQFRAALEITKIETGLPGNLFSHSFKEFGHLATEGWVKSAWKEFQNEDIEIIEQTTSPSLIRQFDKFLITSFHDQGKYRNSSLEKLNQCRIIKGVLTLGHLVTGDGMYLLPEALGSNPILKRHEFEWPNQGEVPEADWDLWRKALNRTFNIRRANKKLSIPLGKWIQHPHLPTNWHDPISNTVFIKQDNGWRCFRKLSDSTYTEITPHHILPRNARRAIARIDEGSLKFYGSSPTIDETQNLPTSLTTSKFLLHKDWQWTIDRFITSATEEEVCQWIRSGTAKAITDGSYKDGKGTSAFGITNQDGTKGIFGVNCTPGHDNIQCSYRSEVGGIIGIYMICWLLDGLHGLTDSTLTIGCDSLDAGKHAIQYQRRFNPNQNHHDLIHAAHELREKLQISITYIHVEGHQAEKYPRRKLDVWAKLNNRMDELAKAYWATSFHHLRTNTCMPNEWKCIVEGRPIVQKFKHTLQRHIETKKLTRKWLKKRGTKKEPKPSLKSPEQIENTDFENAQIAWKKLTGNQQRFATKIWKKALPTGRWMERYEFWNHSKCPICKQSDETTEHVFTCPNEYAIEERKTALSKFQTQLDKIHTAPDLKQLLIQILEHTLLNKPIILDTELRPSVHAIFIQQQTLDPIALLQGEIAQKWAAEQHTIFEQYAPWRTGHNWASALITALWQLSFDIWDYRNDVLHRRLETPHNIDLEQLNKDITTEWNKGYMGWTPMNSLLFKGLNRNELLKKNIPYKQNWLLQIQEARQAQIRSDEEDHKLRLAEEKKIHNTDTSNTQQRNTINHTPNNGNATHEITNTQNPNTSIQQSG